MSNHTLNDSYGIGNVVGSIYQRVMPIVRSVCSAASSKAQQTSQPVKRSHTSISSSLEPKTKKNKIYKPRITQPKPRKSSNKTQKLSVKKAKKGKKTKKAGKAAKTRKYNKKKPKSNKHQNIF